MMVRDQRQVIFMDKGGKGQQLDFFEDNDQEETGQTLGYRQQLEAILEKTDDFRIIERVPITKKNIPLPYTLADKVGDEVPIVFLDTETTGLSTNTERIIELGMVSASFSPSAKKLVSIDRIFSEYEDPGKPVPEEITRLTGITDQDVKGQKINDAEVQKTLEGIELIVAHNAGFDRPFFEKRFPDLGNKRWACSLKGVDWKTFDINNHRQEELLHGIGYFYEAHRASIDCLALAWFMHIRQDVFANLLENASQNTVVVHAFGAPFDTKGQLKAHGYRWDDGSSGSNRHWWREIPEEGLAEEQAFLNSLYALGSEKATFIRKTAENRFRRQ